MIKHSCKRKEFANINIFLSIHATMVTQFASYECGIEWIHLLFGLFLSCSQLTCIFSSDLDIYSNITVQFKFRSFNKYSRNGNECWSFCKCVKRHEKKNIPVPECWKIYGLFWKVTCSSITGVAPLNQSYIIIYMPR